MALLCDWNTKIITVPKADLTLVSGTLYTLDVVKWFQLLRELNGDVEGIAETVREPLYNNTPPTSSTPRIVDVINGYTCQMEDGLYNVEMINGNTNWREVEIKNQVGVGTNNTTGFIDPVFLEYGLFNGHVTVDLVNGYALGFNELVGTSQFPVNSMADALTVRDNIGLPNDFYINSNVLINGSLNFNNSVLKGKSHVNINIIIEESALVNSCRVVDAIISGTLDGGTSLENCVVKDITFFNGHIHDSSLSGKMILGGDADAFFKNISQLNFTVTPEIDMGITGQDLVIDGYTGLLKITNFNSDVNAVGVYLKGGKIILNSADFVKGFIHVSGTGRLVDENDNDILSGTWNTNVTVINELLNAVITENNDLLKADEEKSVQTNKYYKRHKDTKTVLVEKDYNKDGSNNETLIEP